MPDGSAFGVFLVDKPAGPTSHDIVAAIRRRMGRGVKVGHAGTLDPFATGLLVIAVGRATRLLQYIVGHDKSYTARVRLGATSATGDPQGPIEPTGRPLPDRAAIAAAVEDLPNMTSQQVPLYSAVKVGGVALHRRARRGETPEPRFRQVAIRDARLGATDPEGNWFDLDVTCSKGTYVRQIAVDLGRRLGCGGYCERLRRTAIGELRVEQAVSADRVPQEGGIDPLAALAPMPTHLLDATQAASVLHGRTLEALRPIPTGMVALVDGDGHLVAVAESSGVRLRPRVVIG